MTEREGRTQNLRCPYNGWTYSLEGELKATPDFAGVRNFDPSANGLVPCQTALWQNWLFVKVEAHGPSLERFLGAEITRRIQKSAIENLRNLERPGNTLYRNKKGVA